MEHLSAGVAADQAGNVKLAVQEYTKGIEYLQAIAQDRSKARTLRAESRKKAAMFRARVLELRTNVSKDGPQLAAESVNNGESPSLALQEKPNVKWDDVIGLEDAKTVLHETLVTPLRFPKLFVGQRKPWKGILLYGPPGTGKTHLARAAATETDASFYAVSSSSIVSKWVGESEKNIRALFSDAREHKPAIIFIDEIDALCARRTGSESEGARRLLTEFLVQVDGISADSNEGIVVMAATNVKGLLDDAVLRRFDKHIHVPLPDEAARAAMFASMIPELPASACRECAAATAGCSGSDLNAIVKEAAMRPLRAAVAGRYFCVRDHTYYPCEADEPGAVFLTLSQIPDDSIDHLPVTAEDVLAAIRDKTSATTR